jgi:hypothetical protein
MWCGCGFRRETWRWGVGHDELLCVDLLIEVTYLLRLDADGFLDLEWSRCGASGCLGCRTHLRRRADARVAMRCEVRGSRWLEMGRDRGSEVYWYFDLVWLKI